MTHAEMWWIEHIGDGLYECVRYPHTHLLAVDFEPDIEKHVEINGWGEMALVWVFTEYADEHRAIIKTIIDGFRNLTLNKRYFLKMHTVDFRDGNVRRK